MKYKNILENEKAIGEGLLAILIISIILAFGVLIGYFIGTFNANLYDVSNIKYNEKMNDLENEQLIKDMIKV